jgi:putative flavoprotein involved in K+ transport
VRLPCAVIGAGPAGLAVSRALGAAGVDHVVLERNDVADTWRHQRWDSFRLNTPGSMNAMLGPVPPDSFTHRDDVVRMLTAQASSLPVRTRTPVTSLDRDGSGFVVRTPGEDIRAGTVVIASGLQNVPRVPSGAFALPHRLLHRHTAGYANAASLPDGAVLVVGSGQSGCQIAEDLTAVGRRVYLSTSRVGRYPWTYRGRALIEWLADCGHWHQRPDDLPTPADVRAAVPVVGSGGRSLDLTRLAASGVTLAGRITGVSGERLTFDATVPATIAHAETVAAGLTAKADRHIEANRIDAPPAEPDPTTASGPPAAITDLDLAAADVTTVIWCTGFTGDLSWARPVAVDEFGRPAHDGCRSPVPGLWFAGFPWLTQRRSGILFGMPDDAASIATDVTRHLAHRA